MQLEPPHGIGCNHALLEAAYIRFPLSLVRFEWPAASPEGKKQTGQAKCSLHLQALSKLQLCARLAIVRTAPLLIPRLQEVPSLC